MFDPLKFKYDDTFKQSYSKLKEQDWSKVQIDTEAKCQEYTSEIFSVRAKATEIHDHFLKIEKNLPFVEKLDWGKFLSFSDNLQEPIHRWFLFKEGYSHRLVTKLLNQFPPPAEYPTILDPFFGSGTTLLVAQQNFYPVVGFEINPFAAFLGKVKTQWNCIDPNDLENTLFQVLEDRKPTKVSLPDLSTLHNHKYFPDSSARKILELKQKIKRCQTSQNLKDVLTLALLSTIEDVSCLHKDGRLLRYFPRKIISPSEAFYNRAKVIIKDLEFLYHKNFEKQEFHFTTRAIHGDARLLDSTLSQNQIHTKFGLIIYSPPYPNNFDYSEIYKCELWLGGFLKSREEWRQLRLRTFRSHPSCAFPKTHYLRESQICKEIYDLVEKTANCSNIGGKQCQARHRAPRVIRGYFDDIYLMLKQQQFRLAPGGHIICIVGNSRHGNLHVPADTIIALIGKKIGLELLEIRIARYRESRNQRVQKLRESLVIFRNPI